MKPLVSIVIINYNTKKYLESCIQSLLDQTWPEYEIIFLDNDSSDGSFEFVSEKYPRITAIKNSKNLGYASAGNQGIKLAKGKYVMTINPDIIFEKDYVDHCVRKMEEDKRIGAIGGKTYKYNFDNNHKTPFIDTVGIFCYRNRRFIDDGQGLEDKGQFDEEKEVFGISGACPVYRKEALEEVKYKDEYFDENFFMYKEDIDLSWRLRLAGWKCWYLPTAIANHGRGTGVLKRFTHLEVAKNRSRLNKNQKYFSFRNQRLTQLKNELRGNFIKDFFPILWKEILIKGYVVFREPYLLKACFDIIGKIPSTLKKRADIMKKRKVDSKEMARWLSGKQSQYFLHELAHPEEQ